MSNSKIFYFISCYISLSRYITTYIFLYFLIDTEEGGISMKQFLSVNEVAELLSVNPMTIYKWCKSGKLPHYTIGGSVIRFDTEQLAKHIEGANKK